MILLFKIVIAGLVLLGLILAVVVILGSLILMAIEWLFGIDLLGLDPEKYEYTEDEV